MSRETGEEDRPGGPAGREGVRSGALDAFGARALRTLTRLERDVLAFPELLEVRAGRLMEKVLSSGVVGDEPEALFEQNALDRTFDCSHVASWSAQPNDQEVHPGRLACGLDESLASRRDQKQYAISAG